MISLIKSMNEGLEGRLNLKEAPEERGSLGPTVDGNQWVAYWTPHNAFGDVSRASDVAVGRLSDVIKDGATRNVVLQGQTGASRIKRIGDTFYNTSLGISKGKIAADNQRTELDAFLKSHGFERVEDRYADVATYRRTNILPGINAEFQVNGLNRPRKYMELSRNGKRLVGGHSASSVISRMLKEIEDNMKYAIKMDTYHTYTDEDAASIDFDNIDIFNS